MALEGVVGRPVSAEADRGSDSFRARTHTIRLIVACSILLAVVIVVGAGFIISNLRGRAIADTERELRNIALVLAQQADHSFNAIELVQSNLIDRMDRMGIVSDAELQKQMSGYEMHLQLRDAINGLPHVESLAIVDARGKIVNFSRSWPVPSISVADRPYFKALTKDRFAMSMLSEPVRNSTTGTWSIYLARKISTPDGELLGFVVGGIERRYFERFFANIALGFSSAVSMLRTDGTLLADYPSTDTPDETGAQDIASRAATLKMLLAGTDRGVGRTLGGDGEQRVVAAHAVAHHPVIVSVGSALAVALADWRTQALYLGGAAAFVALVIVGIAFIGAHQFNGYVALARERAARSNAEVGRKAAVLVLKETERVQKILNKQKIVLDGALENMSQGLIMLDADARMLMCNNRYVEMYGMSAEIVKPGCTLRAIIEHRAAIGLFNGNIDETVRKILAAIVQGKPSRSITELADGRGILVLTQPMTEGGWVATHEDITNQRRAEREADRMQRFLLTVIENVPSTIVVKNAKDFKYVLINRAGEKFYGIPRARVLGQTSHELFPKATADVILGHDKMLLQTDGETRFDAHEIETPGNGRRLVVARRLPIRDDDGKPQFLLSVIDDVAARGPGKA